MIEHTHLNSLIAQLVKTLAVRGFDTPALLRQAGMDPAQLDKADVRIPCAQVDRLWQAAMAASGEDWTIILDTARRYDSGTLHVLGFGLQACANLIEASERLARACVIFNTALAARCTSADGEFQIAFEYQYAGSAGAKDIVTAAILLHIWRSLLHPGLAPLGVDFANVGSPADPAMHAALEAFFGCPVRFRQKRNCMRLALASAQQALPNANAMLAARGDAIVDAYLGEMQRAAIGHAVARCIAAGVLQKEEVARSLNMSPRTLQRRLHMNQLSFAQLLTDTRRSLACSYLRSGRFAVKEVAYMLGYSDPANFSRAFRSWYGQSPEAYRAADHQAQNSTA
ncbi:MAG: AraC family transcriptional regulator ligand-binding domain-containing protein [Massilia sp.]